MEPYRSYFPHAHLLLPRTERLSGQVMVLPTGTAISEQDIARICGVMRTALSAARPVRERLARLPPGS